MTFPKTIVPILFAACIFSACTKQNTATRVNGESGVDPAVFDEQLYAILNDANEQMMNGKTNAAVTLLSQTLADKKFPPGTSGRQMILEHLLHISLLDGQRDEALARVLALAKDDPELALGGLNVIYDDVRQKQTPDEALAWIDANFNKRSVPAPILARAQEWEVLLALDLKQDDRAIQILSTLLNAKTDNLQLVQRSANILLDSARYDSLVKLIAVLDARQKKSPSKPVETLLLSTKTRLVAAIAKWDEYTEIMKTAIATLDDSPLYLLLVQTVPLAEKAKQTELVTNLCKSVITSQPAKTSSVRYLGQLWGKDAQANAPADFPNRIQTMIDANVDPGITFDILNAFFYATAENPDPAITKKLFAQCQTLLQKHEAAVKKSGKPDDYYAMTIPLCLVDMAFTLNDFDAALACLEKGIPEKDDAWIKMASAKVKAHRAMANNQNKEATEYFRVFMTALAETTKDDELSDPSTNLLIPKEVVLARNAQRIADLLAGIDNDGAAKAAQEARDYYLRALELAKDPDAKILIEKEIKNLQTP